MKNYIVLLMSTLIILSACASPHVVAKYQAGDDSMDCAALNYEIRRVEDGLADARAEKGVTGTNVGAALFWWPGLVATYVNVGEAVSAANERIDHLTSLKYKKGC